MTAATYARAIEKDEASLLGRGGQQHKYLQQLVKRIVEDKGYKATIEKAILKGMGKVDVALEKHERSIACEISVTSTEDYELSNLQKCLAGGFPTLCWSRLKDHS